MASVPFAEYQKLSLWWLGFSQQELENKLIGGRRARSDTAEVFSRYFLDINRNEASITGKKYCCIVIGNPVYNNREWQLNEMIKKNASDVGLTLLKEIARMKYRLTKGKMKREFILIFKN
jgi:hypothetical protein